MRTSRLLLPLCSLTLAFAACGGDKNYDERRQAPEAAAPLDTTPTITKPAAPGRTEADDGNPAARELDKRGDHVERKPYC